jgi:hypothetical protein
MATTRAEYACLGTCFLYPTDRAGTVAITSQGLKFAGGLPVTGGMCILGYRAPADADHYGSTSDREWLNYNGTGKL